MGYNTCWYTLEFRFIGQLVRISMRPPVLAYLHLNSPKWENLLLAKQTCLHLSETNSKNALVLRSVLTSLSLPFRSKAALGENNKIHNVSVSLLHPKKMFFSTRPVKCLRNSGSVWVCIGLDWPPDPCSPSSLWVPTSRIVPVSKWLVTSICKALKLFITILTYLGALQAIVINHLPMGGSSIYFF